MMLRILLHLLTWICFRCFIIRVDGCIYIDYLDKKFNITEIGCPSNAICNEQRVFSVRYIETPPYFIEHMMHEKKHVQLKGIDQGEGSATNGILQSPVEQLLQRCCGTCTNIKKMKVLRNIAQLTLNTMNGSDFIYPVSATASMTKMYGYYYIPLIDIPGMVYAVEQPSVQLTELFYNLFPVSIVNILLCVVAGFVCLILETWNNKEDFPRGFLIGWYEGIWWAFVSMTTVGYGDKTPKSILGRIHSIVWITVGILAYGLLTGIVFTQVEEINSPPPADMNGKSIGSLLFRDYDAIMIGDSGGRSVRNNPVKYWEFHKDLLRLIEKLECKMVDGIVGDQFTFTYGLYWTRIIQENQTWMLAASIDNDIEWTKSRIEYMKTKVLLQKISYRPAQSFTYGILVKNRDDYEYFKEAAEHLRQNIGRQWNEIFQALMISDQKLIERFYHPQNNLYSRTGEYFHDTLIAIVSMVVFILVVGFLYEMMRKQRSGKEQCDASMNNNQIDTQA